MRVNWLQMVLFCTGMGVIAESLRAILGTHLGILVIVLAIVFGLLWLLYLAMKAIALVVWELGGILAQLIGGAYRWRMAVKESSHATRLV
jgi:hypothetical protein